MVDEDRIAYARALFEKLEGISRQRTSVEQAIRHYRILELRNGN
jgi:hypothetical protein